MAGRKLAALLLAGLIATWALPAGAAVVVQCPGDMDGDAIPEAPDPYNPNTVCMHLSAGDGFVNMADGYLQYMFGFADMTGVMPDMVMMEGMSAGTFPSPLITVKEGQKLYLTITNVGMMMRPDLFDPHSLHWHGFPEQAVIFDGEPMGSLSINMGASFTYYYNVRYPGTYMYHCHVEATEHMQMGMLGNLYVTPAQDELPDETMFPNGWVHQNDAGQQFHYAYNDGDGSTYYDVDFPIQMAAFDPAFHDASLTVQPLPFALMEDRYPMINGRGYPDTINPDPLANTENGVFSQPESALVTADHGDKILLRISSLATVDFFTLASPSIPMRVVGKDARLLRGPDGADLSYMTNSVTLGGGQSVDAIVDTALAPPGTYVLYTTNVDNLCNDAQDFGGMMTEIVVSP